VEAEVIGLAPATLLSEGEEEGEDMLNRIHTPSQQVQAIRFQLVLVALLNQMATLEVLGIFREELVVVSQIQELEVVVAVLQVVRLVIRVVLKEVLAVLLSEEEAVRALDLLRYVQEVIPAAAILVEAVVVRSEMEELLVLAEALSVPVMVLPEAAEAVLALEAI
jgi:hypothetical protein